MRTVKDFQLFAGAPGGLETRVATVNDAEWSHAASAHPAVPGRESQPNVATREVLVCITRRHRRAENTAVSCADRPRDACRGALHVIGNDNSRHTTEGTREFLIAYPRCDMHLTPTSGSCLDAVETCSRQLERRTRRHVFASVSSVRDEIGCFLEAHKVCSSKPFRWTKSDGAIIEAVEQARTS